MQNTTSDPKIPGDIIKNKHTHCDNIEITLTLHFRTGTFSSAYHAGNNLGWLPSHQANSVLIRRRCADTKTSLYSTTVSALMIRIRLRLTTSKLDIATFKMLCQLNEFSIIGLPCVLHCWQDNESVYVLRWAGMKASSLDQHFGNIGGYWLSGKSNKNKSSW